MMRCSRPGRADPQVKENEQNWSRLSFQTFSEANGALTRAKAVLELLAYEFENYGSKRGVKMAEQGWTDKRPMSPHLQVWKFHPTMLSSILHRATGVGNALGLALVIGWLFAVASGPDAFEAYDAFFGSIIGKVILFGFTVSIFYHFSNGIRHLVWDAGKGFGLGVANFWSVFSMLIAVVASVALWAVAGGFAF